MDLCMSWHVNLKNNIVGLGTRQSGPNSIWAQGPCRGGLLPRTDNQWSGCQWE